MKLGVTYAHEKLFLTKRPSLFINLSNSILYALCKDGPSNHHPEELQQSKRKVSLRVLGIHFLLLACFYCQGALAQKALPSIGQEKMQGITSSLDKFIINFSKTKTPPSCVVAIVGPNDVYFLKAYGIRKLGQPERLTEKTLFQLGSVSKPLTATLVGILQTQQKLSIQNPVTNYLKDFKLQGQEQPLLIKHLLSHTSGVPRKGFNALVESFTERSKIFEKAQHTELAAQPGQHFDYHNVMFALTEDVLEAAMHQPLEKLLQNNLFKPLNMPIACVGFQPLKESSNSAFPHVKNAKGKILPRKKYSQAYYAIAPAGGINASMEDLIPFLQAHLGGFPDVMGTETLNLLHASQIEEDHPPGWLKEETKHVGKTGYALGWRWMDYAGQRVLFHGGWVGGFHNMVAFLPEHKVGIIILHNAETRLSLKAALKFLDLYLKAS
ncbi:MAG TPA: serine hydrolase domain-containing protein [Alphaproteobacteria bacterium]|nr:serine hydrolase domain-containing protein [Alphaproteobacteria bacterium]